MVAPTVNHKLIKKLYNISSPKRKTANMIHHRTHAILVLAAIVLTYSAMSQTDRRHRVGSRSVTVYSDAEPPATPQPATAQPGPRQWTCDRITPAAQAQPPPLPPGKTQKCPRCKGEGVVKEWVDCEQCAGTGKVPDGVFRKRGISGRTATIQTRQKRCPACKDSIGWSGKVKRETQCPRCNGSGTIPKD